MEGRFEMRNSKSEARSVQRHFREACPPRRRGSGVKKVVDSRLRGNDAIGQFSNFEFRISSFGLCCFEGC
jgi:hypothetical protein